MDKIKRKNNSLSVLLLTVLMLFISCFSLKTVTTKAETVEETQEITIEMVVENMTFVTFTKGENEKYNQFIFGCFYIPDTVYDTALEYGVVVFPRWFAERYGVTGNYIDEYTALGMGDALSIMVVDNPVSMTDGKVLKCGIINIPEAGENIELSFIFYVKDTAGNIAYATPRHAAYATLLAENYSNEEIALMIGQRVTTENSFKQIVIKLEELIDAFWTYIIMAGVSVVAVWGAVIGIKIAVAKQKEEQINARGMLKNLVIGIIIIFVIAVACPLLINGLASWLAW